mmetsp:Transcript_9305/g.8220  ORF Transcript_9305/g.8220 Transcript_9305/m.8220 type:complete len:198 (-) Transcript_9305:74-667(-)
MSGKDTPNSNDGRSQANSLSRTNSAISVSILGNRGNFMESKFGSKKSLFSKENTFRLPSLKNREHGDISDTDSQHSKTFSTKSMLMTPKIENRTSKFSPMHKPNFEKKMRAELFNDSNVYMGFSSQKREDLADDYLQPSMYRSQIYKEEEPSKPYSLKPAMSNRCSNPDLKNIRDYNDSRSEFLSTLNRGSHTRSTS